MTRTSAGRHGRRAERRALCRAWVTDVRAIVRQGATCRACGSDHLVPTAASLAGIGVLCVACGARWRAADGEAGAPLMP